MAHEESHEIIFYHWINKVAMEQLVPWRESYKTCPYTSKDDAVMKAISAIMDAEADLKSSYEIHKQAQEEGHPYALQRDQAAGVWVPVNGDSAWVSKENLTIYGIKLSLPKPCN
jgi:hypothetical protein